MDSIDKIHEEEKEKRKVKVFQENFAPEYENAKLFYKEQPFFYDKNKQFWFWQDDLFCYEMVDELDIVLAIDKGLETQGKLLSGKLKNIYIDVIKAVGRDNIPKEPLKEWVQFKDTIYDLKTKETYKASPNFFFTNSIPFKIGTSSQTPTMDKLLESWVGKQYVQTMYEIIAYCCLRDYPIHSLFCFIGPGRNGKSRFLTLLSKFVGTTNSCSTELDQLIESRFESAKMFKKLVTFLGETNFGVIEKTSIIKKLTGQDLIGGEFKGKMPFDFMNYSKLCVSSNSLPSSTDTSEGFYRRWMIIDFPNEFPEGKDILETIPEEEYENLANKVLEILPRLISEGKFSNQGSIEERKQKYIMASNPISLFLRQCCDSGVLLYVKYTEFYLAYLAYLTANKRRRISKKEFARVLEDEGLAAEKKTIETESGWYICGVTLKQNWQEIIQNDKNDKNDVNLTQFLHIEKPSEKHVISVTSVISKNQQVVVEDIDNTTSCKTAQNYSKQELLDGVKHILENDILENTNEKNPK